MAAQTFSYKKVSELPSVSQLAESDVFIVNKSGETSKITLDDLKAIFNGAIETDISDIKTSLLTETLFINDALFITKCGNSITATFRGLEITSSSTLVGTIDSKYFTKSLIFSLVADGISMESKVLSVGTSGQLRPYSQVPAVLNATIKASGQVKWDF